MNPHTFDMAAHETRLDRLIAGSFSASYMSNSKWRRLFLALEQSDVPIPKLRWKFVGREEPVTGATPDESCLGTQYITRTSFSAFPYKEIEWVEIPELKELPPAALAVGLFETETCSGGVRVYGYKSGT